MYLLAAYLLAWESAYLLAVLHLPKKDTDLGPQSGLGQPAEKISYAKANALGRLFSHAHSVCEEGVIRGRGRISYDFQVL